MTDILESLAGRATQDDILRDFPYLEPDDIKAALAYAARQADHAKGAATCGCYELGLAGRDEGTYV